MMARPSRETEDTSMPNILIVDDSATDRTLAGKLLEREGDFSITFATNGCEALEQICAERPFLAVLDINMPALDGYGVCQELERLGGPFERLPVILLTKLRSRALEILGGELGAYLQKPVDRDQLLEAVNTFVPETHCG